MAKGAPAFRYWLYQMKAVIGQLHVGRFQFIPTSAVEYVCTYRMLQRQMYGMASGGVMLVPVNHLSLLEINVLNE